MSLDNLPVEWFETTLDQIAEWGSGGTPSRKNASYYGGDVPWIKTGDLGDKYVTQATEFITEEAVKNSSAKFFKKGSVIMAMYGATIGKTSILGINATTNQACAVGTPIATSTEFLYYFLRNEKDSFIAKGKGGAQPNISQQIIKAHTVYLPALAEQQEIVRQLDVMLAQVEQIKARLDAIPAILKKFRQSVLADAVSGKLTEEWRKSNPHTISIETIESCRLNKWWLEKQKDLLSKGKKVTEKDKAKYKPAYLPESNFYGAIPPEWSLCTIDHLFDVTKLAGFEFTKFVKYHDDYDIPVIKAENVGKNGFKETQFSKVEKTVVDALPRSSIFGNELLIVFVGAGTGQVGRVPSNRRYFLGPNVALVKPNLCDLINSEFFEYLLRSLSGQDSLLSFAKGAAQPSLSMDQIRHATIVVPPIEEQEVILASIKILFNKASQIESLVNIAQKRVNLLTQSILAKAFSGELTAEWREQHQELITGINSAESLLAKIQKEREASKPVKKAKKVK
jgi:type I restriction enzyme S subunit